MPYEVHHDVPGIHHCTMHATGDEQLCLDAVDFRNLAADVAAAALGHAWTIIDLCLMPNHAHLLFEAHETGPAAGIRWLNSRYVRRVNRRRGRKGALLRRRHFRVLVEREPHLLELTRYLPLNPAKDGFCAAPEHWPWSGYRAVAGLPPQERLPVEPRNVLRYFGDDVDRARRRYVRFVADGLALLRGERAPPRLWPWPDV